MIEPEDLAEVLAAPTEQKPEAPVPEPPVLDKEPDATPQPEPEPIDFGDTAELLIGAFDAGQAAFYKFVATRRLLDTELIAEAVGLLKTADATYTDEQKQLIDRYNELQELCAAASFTEEERQRLQAPLEKGAGKTPD